jgi:hypothetical protein
MEPELFCLGVPVCTIMYCRCFNIHKLLEVQSFLPHALICAFIRSLFNATRCNSDFIVSNACIIVNSE